METSIKQPCEHSEHLLYTRSNIRILAQAFAHKELMLHRAQGLPQYLISNEYRDEESKFLSKVLENANMISSHVSYKFKVYDNVSLKTKARWALHENNDKERIIPKSYFARCPPNGIRIIFSIPTVVYTRTLVYIQGVQKNRQFWTGHYFYWLWEI